MKFTLEIELGNETMKTLFEVIVSTASSLNDYGANNNGTMSDARDGDHGRIRDINGNTVGKWEVVA